MTSKARQQELAYEAWVDAELDQALARADDPNTRWFTHDEVQECMRRQRESLVARIHARDAEAKSAQQR